MKIKTKVNINAIFSSPQNKNTYDAFLIIAGSGKVDHNGDAKGMPLKIYKELSDYLVELGFATLRYDKRGVGESEGSFLEVGLQELLEDIDGLVDYLKSRKDVKRVFLLGHSEGCILSSIYHMSHDIDGMIQLGGAGTSLKSALLSQNLVVLEEIERFRGIRGWLIKKLITKEKIIKSQTKIFEKVERSEKTVLRVQLMRLNAKWMREHFKYTDAMILERLKTTPIKTLCISGSKDVQANPKDLEVIKNLGNPNIQVKVIENMDHVLRQYTGDKTILKAKKQYMNEINKPLHPELLQSLSDFIKEL